MTQPNFRDVELLSTYLDGELSQAESARLETRLKTDPQLRTILDDLSQSRALLRKLPARRAPRNFTLTPKMAGVKPPVPRAFPVFRFASALAAILFFFGFAINLTAPVLSGMHAAAPMAYGKGGGEPAQEAAAAPTEAPAAPAAPIAPPEAAAQAAAPTEAPAATTAPAPAMPTEALSATDAPALAAPGVPEPTMSAQDNSAASPTLEAPRVMVAAETETPAPTPTMIGPTVAAKMAPTEPLMPTEIAPTELPVTEAAPPPARPTAIQPPVPLAILAGLFILAVLAGAAALFVSWQADRKFGRK